MPSCTSCRRAGIGDGMGYERQNSKHLAFRHRRGIVFGSCDASLSILHLRRFPKGISEECKIRRIRISVIALQPVDLGKQAGINELPIRRYAHEPLGGVRMPPL